MHMVKIHSAPRFFFLSDVRRTHNVPMFVNLAGKYFTSVPSPAFFAVYGRTRRVTPTTAAPLHAAGGSPQNLVLRAEGCFARAACPGPLPALGSWCGLVQVLAHLCSAQQAGQQLVERQLEIFVAFFLAEFPQHLLVHAARGLLIDERLEVGARLRGRRVEC